MTFPLLKVASDFTSVTESFMIKKIVAWPHDISIVSHIVVRLRKENHKFKT